MENPVAEKARYTARPGAITVAVDPVALVVTECITVTSAMRKHTRWAHSSVAAILGAGASGATAEARRSSGTKPLPSARVEQGSREPAINLNDDVGLASRWGLRGKKGQSMQDNPLLSAFARLRSNLKGCKDIHNVHAPVILHPFLQVIRSSSTSAPITSLALIAITKFFAYNIISRDSPQLPLAMQLLSSAVTHCRFEASDSATDEIVLFRILKLMEYMITGPGGDVLGDESMCEMMETGLSMCCQVRLSELLRRSAEVSMVTMCQTIFQRLKHLEIEVEDIEFLTRRNSTKTEIEGPKMDPATTGDVIGTRKENLEPSRTSQSLDLPRDKGGGINSANPENNGKNQIEPTPSLDENRPSEIKPYSLPSIRELFRVLVSLLDPHDRQHNDTMRVMALRIIDVALEVAGPSIASHPSLATLAKDTLCRYLFQLVRSENIPILHESLRVAGTLLATCRRVLKLQQELYVCYLVACLHPRVEIPQEAGIDPALYDGVPQTPRLVKQAPSSTSSGRSTPVPVKDRQRLGMEGGMRKPDAREAMIESVGALVRIPSFMSELYVNYDCEIDRSDLCLDMVGLLSRNAFPDAATWSTTNVPPLCLDALLGYIQAITDRLEEEPNTKEFPLREQLQEQRAQKKVIIKGVTKFNENPKAGIAFLVSEGIIDDGDNPQSVASFLKGTTRVDKRVLGDFLSKKTHETLLSSFMNNFDFDDMRVDEALRQVLNSFRLPGEAPLIARIVNEFAARYFASAKPTDIADKDSLYVLTYAIIMLNTDQHNPNVKSQARMSFQQFARNLRGVNNGKDFEPEYLEEIYDSIRTREIVLPEEHDNKQSFDHAWKELLFKVQSTNDLRICDTNMYDADMFAATWRPVVATLTYVFMSATDDTVFSRVVTGFDQCAQIAAKHGLHEALDHIVFCLSSISALASPTIPSTALNTEVQVGEKSVMVSETAVKFGRDFKAQLATVVLFRVVIGHETSIRDGWKHLVLIMLNLFVNSLLTIPYSSIFSNADVPPIPLQSPAQVVERGDRASEGGLFSALSSYVSSFANDEPPEPSEQEIEYTLCTVDCVKACSFENLFSNISQLPLGSLKIFISTLLDHIPEGSSPRVIVVKPDLPAPTPVRPNGQKVKSVGLAYDPSLVFILEFATILAARDAETLASLGKEVGDALQTVVRDASHMHPVTLSRAVYYLLSFLRACHDHDFIRAPVVLHTISKFDEELVKQSAAYVVKGISLCIKGPPGLRNEMVNSPDFWSVLKSLSSIPESADAVFKILQDVVEGSTPALTADNYEPAVSLLNDFATAASVGATDEQRRDQALRRGKQPSKRQQPSEIVQRGQKAMQIVYQITSRTPSFIQLSHLEPYEAWIAYWSPPFRTFTTHSLNPCRAIRSQSLASLQRVLLSPSLIRNSATKTNATAIPSTPDTREATALFTDVLFPLLTQLLKPEIWHSDPIGMGETRLQAALLCCKVFLRYLDSLLAASTTTSSSVAPSPSPPDPEIENGVQNGETEQDNSDGEDGIRLWAQILQMMERLLKSGGSEGLEEAVPESLKNIVLVMANGGYLVPPRARKAENASSHVQERLWEVSWTRLERFLPGLMGGVFPETLEEEGRVESTTAVERASEKVGRGSGEKGYGQEREREQEQEQAQVDERNGAAEVTMDEPPAGQSGQR